VLLLEDGTVLRGRMASPGTRFGEVVFNTAMSGYQEVLTDPSYHGQIVVMTQPHIGNYGTAEEAQESARPWVEGFVARQFTRHPSGTLAPDGRHGAGSEDLVSYLRRHEVPALEGIDTRCLVRLLRDHGSLRGVISSKVDELERLSAELEDYPGMEGRALVDDVTCAEPWEFPAEGEARFHLAVYDFGIKTNILRCLAEHGARCTVLPARTPAEKCLALRPDGVVLSNGPGDPEPLGEIIDHVRELVHSDVPILGICLGHQLLGLALGGRTFKLKFGHHGGNQPVRDVDTGSVAITSQNHGFALEGDSLPDSCRVTAINLNDDTVEAFRVADRPVFSVQYHPEAAPGPHDAARIFGEFLDTLEAKASEPTVG
jgi:carbamoyl-phosphate synthase small subunit